MNSSDSPSRITKAFGVNGDKNTIPTDSTSITDNSGIATFDKGFPPITMQPLSAGGIPPSGKDMNGVIYSVTLQQQWQNAGMTYSFDANFATSVSGYPRGAVVPSTALTGQWLNLNEANSNTPESPIGAATGWAPLNNYGVTAVSGLSNASVVLSSLQAAKDRIILTGVLSANINLTFPTWTKSWTIVNNCTGAFSVTCKTLAGTGVIIPSGQTAVIVGDGLNIVQDLNLLGIPGRLLNKQTFKTPGTFTYTPSLGVRLIIVEVQGGGGGGGGVVSAAGGAIAGSGGGGGGYGRSTISSGFSGAVIKVGSGGSGVTGQSGIAGSESRFGSFITSSGGIGGTVGASTSSAVLPAGTSGQGGGSTSTEFSRRGGFGGVGLIGPAFSLSGAGGDSFLASQTPYGASTGTTVNPGNSASDNTGAGGSGAIGVNNGASAPGGSGGSGVVVIWEFS